MKGMKGITWRRRAVVATIVAVAGTVAAASLAVATAAAGNDRVVHFSETFGPFTNSWGSCGAQETVTVSIRGTAFFDAEGNWVRSLEHFFYDSVLTGPTGKSISFDAHQNAEFTAAGIVTLTGQGANIRAPGLGLLYQDVGRLVFDQTVPFPGEALFVSAKSVAFEAFDPDAVGAAACAAVG